MHGKDSIVEGIGRTDGNNRVSSLKSADRITRLDPLDVPARLDEFRNMKDGWLEGDGRAPDHAGLDWLAAQFARHYADDLPRPYLYPTPEGGVQAEWSIGPHEASIEIDLAERRAEWHCLDVRTAVSSEEDIDLDRPDAWQWIVREIRQMERGAE